MAALPFTVVGGFLGAGKTTLLNRILSHSQNVRFAVLVNDFGALNIDAALVEAGDGAMVPLSNGCACCSLAGGLVQAMMRLMRQAERFDHIVVEASGVANPSRIMDFARLDKALQPNLTLVLVDALHFGKQRADARLSETMDAQLQSADMFLLTKTDLAAKPQQKAVEAALGDLRPDVPRLTADWQRLRPESLLQALAPAKPASGQALPPEAGHGLHSLAMRAEAPVDVQALRRLMAEEAGGILRAKGVLRATHAHTGIVYQQVAGRIELGEGAGLPDASELVVIGAAPLGELAAKLRRLGFRPHG